MVYVICVQNTKVNITHNLQLTRVELLLMEVVAFPKLSIKVEADIILPSSEEDSL